MYCLVAVYRQNKTVFPSVFLSLPGSRQWHPSREMETLKHGVFHCCPLLAVLGRNLLCRSTAPVPLI